MVQTRSQFQKYKARMNMDTNNDECQQQQPSLRQKVLEEKSNINFVIDPNTPYLTKTEIKNDILKSKYMNIPERKNHYVCLFEKMCISTDLDIMKHPEFIHTMSQKLLEFSKEDYTMFCKLLLPMLKHMHLLCNKKLKNRDVIMNGLFDRSKPDGWVLNKLEEIIVRNFCVSDVEDPLYKNVLNSLNENGQISLERTSKLMEHMNIILLM